MKIKKKQVKRHMVFLSFFASHSGAGFCKVLAVKIDSQQRMKKLFKFTVRKFAHLKFAQLKFVQLLYFCPMLVKKKDAQTGCHGGPGGIRASDLGAPSLNCLRGTFPGPPCKSKIPNPKSGIQNLKFRPKSKLFWPGFGDFGFWAVM